MSLTPRRGAFLLVAFLAIVSAGPSLWNDFAWDDRPLIVENRLIRDPGGLPTLLTSGFWQAGDRHDRFRAFYRPLVSLSYVADSAWSRLRPFGFHLTNLLLHAGVSLLVLALLARRESIAAAACGAGLFAVHPVHVESFAWISGRTDLLCALFVVTAFLLDRPGARRLGGMPRAAAFAAFFCGLMAKEMAATLPLLLAADRLIRPGPWRLRARLALRTALPYVLILAAYLLLRRAILGPERAALYVLGPLAWSATAVFVLARDLTLLLLPVGLDPHYPYAPRTGFDDPVVLLATALLAAAAGSAAAWSRRSRRAAIGCAWMGLAVLPVLRFGTFGDVLLADRFLYLPSVGFAILAARGAGACGALVKPKALRRLTVAWGCALALLAGMSMRQSRIFKDDRTLFGRLVATSPASAMVRSNLGLALYDAGDYERAKEEFRNAIALAPGYALAHNNLAAALEREGGLEQAASQYRETLRLAPDLLESRINLASVRVRLGQVGQGLETLRAIVREHPRYPPARYALADALERAGWDREAESEAAAALRLDPSYAEPYYLIGKVRYEAGRTTEAADALEQFLERWRHDDDHRRAAAALVGRIRSEGPRR